MANPIVAILSIAGVVGTGAAAVSVNTQLVEQASEPVYVTVEGQPVVVGGGIEAILPKTTPTPSVPKVVTREVPAGQVQTRQQVQVQAAPAVQQPAAVAPAPAPAPPAAHTGASGVSGENEEEYEDEEEFETEDIEEEFETEDIEEEEYEEEDDD